MASRKKPQCGALVFRRFEVAGLSGGLAPANCADGTYCEKREAARLGDWVRSDICWDHDVYLLHVAAKEIQV